MIDLLRKLRNKEDIQNLFIERLNFSHSSGSISSSLSDKLRKEIISIEKIAEQDQFFIIYCILPKLLKGSERPISVQLSKTFTYNLIIFSNENETEFHFTNLKYIEKKKEIIKTPHRPFRRIVIGPSEKLRTAAERIELLKIEDETESSLLVNLKCDKAFDVEAVSRDFYKDYVDFYREFRTYLMKRNRISQTKADEYTETIFNRIFFLYFVQKKDYLQKNPNFIFQNFKNISTQNFYIDFLIPLFEKISNNIKSIKFQNIPFLNGGLFEFTDSEKKIKIDNEVFETVLSGLFEKYNFTVREDTELEKEVAIDPEMLGTIFERLILGLEQNKYRDIPDARRASGSYYTPKFIVSFMVKQSLLNDLVNQNTLHLNRSKTKELVFNLKTEKLTEIELKKIRERLLEIRIVDPAVGSGAYPVGILLKIVEIIEAIDKKIAPEERDKENYRYKLKRKIIEDCIYGVDLQPKAVHLTNLRLWLSLIVDLDVENINQIPPLPNLDFNIYQGNSLISKIAGYDFDQERKLKPDVKGLKLLEEFQKAKKAFQKIVILAHKNKVKEEISKLKTDYLKWFLNKKKEEEIKYLEDIAEGQGNFFEKDEQNIDLKKDTMERIKQIEKKLAEVHLLSEHFNWGLDFFDEIETKGGFDIVIANPPYGIKVDVRIRDEFKLNSKDSYSIFVSLGLKILKPKGTLCYIMSDTWQTIKSHKNLRDQLLKETDAQFLISVPPDTFGATVNTGVYTFIKKITPRLRLTENADNWLIAADLSPFKIKQPNGSWDTGNLEAGFELLAEQDDFNETKDGYTLYSEKDFAVFAYRQKLIPRFSNHSFFVASPKLFKLMEDTGKSDMIDGKTINKIDFNGKELELVKLGDIADVKQGLATGDNDYYIRQSKPRIKGASKNYNVVDRNLVLKEEEIERITNNEELRKEVIEKGVSLDPNSGRYFEGRYFVLYDKGGASDIEAGWLPNYYVPTDYFIDWSKKAVERMKTLTIADRIRLYNENKEIQKHYEKTTAAVFRGEGFYFKDGLTFSQTGIYCPTFRLCSKSIFGTEGQYVNIQSYQAVFIASKIQKYLLKCFVNSSVHVPTDDIKEIKIFKTKLVNKLIKLFDIVVREQKQNPKYNYMTNEQLEIDKLVYQMYNLDDEDIKEVENWYWRRYPKLSEAIEVKLRFKEHFKDKLYFTYEELKGNIFPEHISFEKSTMDRYIYNLTKSELIFDAGKGWYSSIKAEFKLETESLKNTFNLMKQEFPLLDFYLWSTQQLAAYFHHVPTRFFTFIYADKDYLQAIYEKLLIKGKKVILNPSPKEADKIFNVEKETIILRPSTTEAPVNEHYAKIELIITELYREKDKMAILDEWEYEDIFKNITCRSRICIASLMRYNKRLEDIQANPLLAVIVKYCR
jgi:hypothetical protein